LGTAHQCSAASLTLGTRPCHWTGCGTASLREPNIALFAAASSPWPGRNCHSQGMFKADGTEIRKPAAFVRGIEKNDYTISLYDANGDEILDPVAFVATLEKRKVSSSSWPPYRRIPRRPTQSEGEHPSEVLRLLHNRTDERVRALREKNRLLGAFASGTRHSARMNQRSGNAPHGRVGAAPSSRTPARRTSHSRNHRRRTRSPDIGP
jgi:hypothetical protein